MTWSWRTEDNHFNMDAWVYSRIIFIKFLQIKFTYILLNILVRVKQTTSTYGRSNLEILSGIHLLSQSCISTTSGEGARSLTKLYLRKYIFIRCGSQMSDVVPKVPSRLINSRPIRRAWLTPTQLIQFQFFDPFFDVLISVHRCSIIVAIYLNTTGNVHYSFLMQGHVKCIAQCTGDGQNNSTDTQLNPL